MRTRTMYSTQMCDSSRDNHVRSKINSIQVRSIGGLPVNGGLSSLADDTDEKWLHSDSGGETEGSEIGLNRPS